MEIAMSQLELYLPATYENILALLLGSAFAMELCKPSLCWVMVSTAAGLVRHCAKPAVTHLLIHLQSQVSKPWLSPCPDHEGRPRGRAHGQDIPMVAYLHNGS
jgi:hypothetical protein